MIGALNTGNELMFLEDRDNNKNPSFENVFIRTWFDAKGLMVSKIFYLKFYIKLLLDKRASNS